MPALHWRFVRILIIGSGGREHALAWRLAQEHHIIHSTPGNPGMAQVGEIVSGDPLAIAESLRPDLTVVGPEGPLAVGPDRGGETVEVAAAEEAGPVDGDDGQVGV